MGEEMSLTPEVLERLGLMAITLERIATRCDAIEGKYEALASQSRDANKHTQTKVEKLIGILNGDDGAGGLIVRLARLEDKVTQLEEEVTETAKVAEDWRRWATRLVVGAVVLGVLAAIGVAVQARYTPIVNDVSPTTQRK